MKPFKEAKQRLAAVLEESARSQLSRTMFARTLAVLKTTEGITRLVVVSRDPQVLAGAAGMGAWPVLETTPGLNEALAQVTRLAVEYGAGALLIVPIDLPRLTAADLQQIIELGRVGPCVVLAPAHRDGGTNALLVSPPGLIRYAFGEQSFSKHQQQAEQAGARFETYYSERVALDFDQPEDLRKLGFSSVDELVAGLERDQKALKALQL